MSNGNTNLISVVVHKDGKSQLQVDVDLPVAEADLFIADLEQACSDALDNPAPPP